MADFTISDFGRAQNPLKLFGQWMKDAEKKEINDPNAASLATVDRNGMPNVRVVLMKGVDDKGFVFYTNFGSVKAKELLKTKKAAMGFHFKSLRRQVRIRGNVEVVTDEEADKYFESRHPKSRLGAWASEQSKPLRSRSVMLLRLAKYTKKFGTKNIPRPPHWSGFRIVPTEIEFWGDGKFRMHDRIQFKRTGKKWKKTRLYP